MLPALAGLALCLGGQGVAAQAQVAPQAREQATQQAQGQLQQPQPAWNAETFRHARETGQLPGQKTLAPNTIDLATAWRLTTENDPGYQAALAEYAASQTERQQGLAALLPQVQGGYSRNRIQGTRTQPNIFGQSVEADLDYDSTSTYLQLQQPVLNYGRYADYQRGQARANEGVATFFVKAQDTGRRLAEAYLNVLLAHNALQLQTQLMESLEKQLKAQQALFEQSEGTVTDARETAARLAVVKADRILADDDLRVAVRQLEALVGQRPQHIHNLKANFPLPPLVPQSVQEWLERARTNNHELRAAREAVNVASAELDKASSAFYPSMDLVASYSDADSENLSTLSQRSNTFTVGLQVSIPIFTGGYNTAAKAQARDTRRQREFEFNATLEKVEAEVTRQYTAVVGGAQRIRALQASVASGELALEGAQRGYEYGQYSNLDVLRAQDTLFQARYDLVRARLEYMLSRLMLALSVGDLETLAFDQVNAVFLGPSVPLEQPADAAANR